ncbi:MAG: efflux RND transporter periplasmic adaptor subunit [Gammaproteobacteria bacterium]|nr:efflux RND transporter periplasmic adaptor subunit [Gammaproteobacteria bacterium]MBV9726922.1 efflux RND transporter periplasmic adaptor subunit [Gammaproteobacteria bacterium]
MSTQKTSNASNTSRRWRWLAAVAAVLVTGGAVYGAYWAQVLRYHQSTDDAYVGGNVVQITPQISGTVVAIGADDTQFVKAGQPLVRLDPADARVALDQAEAQLARTVRDVRNLYATSSQLAAAVQMRQTELSAAQRDLARRERLGVTGAISGEELQHAADAVKTAQAELVAAQQQLAANRARVDGTTLKDHPQVRDAAASVRNAYLTLERTELSAPVSGLVARRNVQLGQRVTTGTPLMAVVPLDQVWVDANFKEPQLAHMRIGQHVTLTADLYGGRVAYHGTVAGFGAGTGAAFSLLPAQNATGNWIKIVQRVPVRIALDPREIAAHPLQIGLSMKAEVDVRGGGSGARLPQVASNTAAWTTASSAETDPQADARVQAIIAANQSAPLPVPTAQALPARESSPASLAANMPGTTRHLH